MTEPTLEDMREYWRNQRNLRRCEGCDQRSTCWSIDWDAYRPKVILKTCPDRDIREAVHRMQEMTEGKPPDYYAITGEWLDLS